MVNCHDVIFEARSWLGTPFRHQGRKKYAATQRGGVDCLGLLIGVAKACGLKGYDGLPVITHDQLHYGHMPDGIDLRAGLEAALLRRDDGKMNTGIQTDKKHLGCHKQRRFGLLNMVFLV